LQQIPAASFLATLNMQMQSHRYEFIEHTADIVIKAYGENLGDAFAASAKAMFDIITGNAEIKSVKTFSFKIGPDDLEGLLVRFLSHLIVLHEVDTCVFGEFDVAFTNSTSLHVTARGETFDPSRHGDGVNVKAVAYHMLEIHEGTDGKNCWVQVLFDV
jgi:SHS2 domain-containing protein